MGIEIPNAILNFQVALKEAVFV